MAGREKRNRNRGSSGNNRKTGDEFLVKNLKKPGVVETESGLQYAIIERGSGASPTENCDVEVHQRIWVLNGALIGDTFKENESARASMSELIEGYREGLMLMNKGARYKFFVPPDLAWGKKGTGNKIPPNALLIFDVRLIDFW